MILSWAKGCASSSKEVIPEKRQKISSEKGSFTCLQCFELHLKGKRDERYKSVCRTDHSTVQRHKNRWHSIPGSKLCTIVPTAAKEVSSLKLKYAKQNVSEVTTPEERNTSTTSSQIISIDPVHSTAAAQGKNNLELATPSYEEYLDELESNTENEENKFMEALSPIEPLEPLEACSNEPQLMTESSDKETLDGIEISGMDTQSTLLSFRTEKLDATKKNSTVDMDAIMTEINKLSLKVDDIGAKHRSLQQLVFEDPETGRQVAAMKKANNINELVEASKPIQWFYDEKSGCAVLRCLPCYELHLKAKPTLADLTPLQAQRILNPRSSGTFATGIFLKKEIASLLIKGHNRTWYREKNMLIDHMCIIGNGSETHKIAMEAYKQALKSNNENATTATHLFKAAIVDLKLGAAARNFEVLVSLLANCSVNVGNIGHGRNLFNDILYCLEKSMNKKTAEFLNQPLPSTFLPPHFWVTIDKATPARTTNQAVLVVARDKNGIPSPIPVAAPTIYTEFTEASYDILALKLLEAISDNFSPQILERLCGVAADGPYQASGFRSSLFRQLEIPEHVDKVIALPITWDTAHVLNLAVTEVRDAISPGGEHFRRFIKRCNVFNHVLANGKGFAFLQMVDSTARRPVSYATQRFMSSSYEQWLKIEQSYQSYWQAFELLHPRRDEDEEWQYMIAGSDFVADLLSFLDIMDPIIDLMLRAQSLDTPIWKLQMWWPEVREILLKAVKGNPLVFPRLSKVEHSLIPGLKFKGVELLQGWLITKDNGKNADGNSRFTWHLRDSKDIEEDRKNLAKELCEALNIRIESLAEKSPSTFEVFDAANLVKLHCGKRVNKEIKYFVDEGEYEVYGVEECKRILTTISELKHVKESGMNFDSRMAYLYMSRIKNAVKAGIWNGKCPEWFIISQNNVNLHTQNATLEEFEEEESNTLDCQFKMVFSNGKVMKVRLHEQRMYQSFYNNEEICHIASKPSCALIDILLAKGGPEAIAESFYSSMRSQQQSGGQSNETLARRTKLQWALPSLQNCKNIIKDGIKTYIQGDDKLRPHRQNTFFSSRNKDYVVSKVIDRIDSDKGRCPFLSDN